MKNYLLLITLLIALMSQNTQAQLLKKIGDRAKRAAEETVVRKIENKTARETGKAMDTILESGKKNKKKKKRRKKSRKSDEESQNQENNEVTTKENTSKVFKLYSKFDFVPGDKILYFDDFSVDNVGDFPSKLNTNGSGELVTIDDKKWLLLAGKSVYVPANITLPENYTIEFDMMTNGVDKKTSSLAKLEVWLHDNNTFERAKNLAKVEIPLCQYASVGFEVRSYKNNQRVLRNIIEKDVRALVLDEVHVSIAVNGKRFRMWMNEKKVIDFPQLVPENIVAFKLYPRGLEDGKDQVFVRNIKIAETGLDFRSQLLNNGKFSTTGILFNSGSAKIKSESYGILKQIGTALQEDTNLKVTIIGHTDSDGSEDSNKKLSEKRALAIKEFLHNTYKIDNERMETIGKGESDPIAPNDTPEGKAKNRRVEFVKL